MATFVSQMPEATPAQMLALASAVNAALRGDTANVGTATCAAGETELTIRDERCRAGRLALLIPLDAAAASAVWWLSAMTQGGMTFRFASPPGECAFAWALLGDGGSGVKQKQGASA